MSSPVFRFAQAKDIEQLVRLRIFMQQETHNIPDADVRPAYADSVRSYFTDMLSNGHYLSAVAEDKGEIIAANGVVFYARPPSLKGKSGYIGYVTNVYTLPVWRNKGIGRRLLDILIDHARQKGVDKLHLGTTAQGQRLYESAGFTAPTAPQLELRFQK